MMFPFLLKRDPEECMDVFCSVTMCSVLLTVLLLLPLCNSSHPCIRPSR